MKIPWDWFLFTGYFEPSSNRWRIASIKALMRILWKAAILGTTCWELESHLFKVLVLLTFTCATKISLVATWKNSHWKVFEKGMKVIWCPVKARTLITHHIVLAELKKLPMSLSSLGFQQWLTHLSFSWLVSKATSLSQHLAKQGLNTWYKLTTMWKTSWDLSHRETQHNMTTQPHMIKAPYALVYNSRPLFLLKSGTLSISLGRN